MWLMWQLKQKAPKGKEVFCIAEANSKEDKNQDDGISTEEHERQQEKEDAGKEKLQKCEKKEGEKNCRERTDLKLKDRPTL